MELKIRQIEENSKTESKDLKIGKREKFAGIADENQILAEEKAFYAVRENINKTFISKNRIY